MSGEAVLISAMLTPTGLAVTGALAAGSLALELVNGWQETRRRKAETQMREQKARIEAWQQFQQNQQDRMQSLSQARGQMRDSLAALRLDTRPITAQATPKAVRPEGFVGANGASKETLARLTTLERLFAKLSGELLDEPDAPLVRLREQVGRLRRQSESGQPPLDETIDDLQAVVERTLRAQLEELEREGEAQQRLTERGERLLEQVTTYAELSTDTGSAEEIRPLRDSLLALLQRKTGRGTDMEVLERRFAQLKERIDAELEDMAVRQGINARTQHHLEEMGYRLLAVEDSGHRSWQLPGGEQVRVVLQRNLGIAFQLQHERAEASDAALSDAELAFFRQQEQQWCDDLAELTRRLSADGFQYELQFERDVPEAAVPIVVVEDVEELLEEEEDRWDDGPRQRRLT